jgi:hypothetical protein
MFNGNIKKGASQFSVCERHINTLGSIAKSNSLTPHLDAPNSAASECNMKEKRSFSVSDYVRLFLFYSMGIFPASSCFLSDIIMTLVPRLSLHPGPSCVEEKSVERLGSSLRAETTKRQNVRVQIDVKTHAFRSCQLSVT